MLSCSQGKLIPLTQGKFAIVDDEDYAELSQYKWHVINGSSTYYAARSTKDILGDRESVLMHRQIMSAPFNMVVDHIDGAGLDNRRANLLLCSNKENLKNTHMRRRFIYENADRYGSDEAAARVYDGEGNYYVQPKQTVRLPSWLKLNPAYANGNHPGKDDSTEESA